MTFEVPLEDNIEASGKASIEAPTENTRQSGTRKVAKNTFIYFLGQLLTWTVTIFTITIIPRRLGETGVGQLATVGTVVLLVVNVFSTGIETYLTKELGRDRTQAERLIGATIGLRIVMIVPAVLLSLVAVYFFAAGSPAAALSWAGVWSQPEKRTLLLLGIVSIAQIPLMFLFSPFGAMMLGWEEAKIYAIVSLILNNATLLAIPFLGHGPLSIVTASLAGWIVVCIIKVVWTMRRIQIHPFVDLRLWRHLCRNGFPYMVNGYILNFYAFGSLAVLRAYGGDAAVGVFSQAGRLPGMTAALPAALASAMLPALARIADQAPHDLKRVQGRVLRLTILIALPCSILLFFLAKPIAHLIYGGRAFHDLPQVLQIFALGIVPIHVATVLYQFLVAQNKANIWTWFLTGTVVLNTVGCLVLVPLTKHFLHNPGAGAALSVLIAECATVVCASWLLRLHTNEKGALSYMARTFLACGGMASVIWLTHNFFVALSAGFGILTFCILVWALRILSAQEQASLVQFVRAKLTRR